MQDWIEQAYAVIQDAHGDPKSYQRLFESCAAAQAKTVETKAALNAHVAQHGCV